MNETPSEARMRWPFAELQVTTCYSFGRGASHPEELFATAAALGIEAMAVTDRNSVAGMVRAWQAAQATGVRLIPGARLCLRGGAEVLAYPTDRAAWARLCRLLTLGKRRAGKGGFDLGWEDLARGGAGLLLALVVNDYDEEVRAEVRAQVYWLTQIAPGRAYVATSMRWRYGDAVRFLLLEELGEALGAPLLATGDVLFHRRDRRRLHDILTCIRHNCTIDEAGYRLEGGGDRHILPPRQTFRLFTWHKAALFRTAEVMRRCRFDLGELRYQYPSETDDPAETSQQALERLTWAGAARRYGAGVPDTVAAQLRHELRLIGQLDYAPYFLTVNSIVRHAREEGILCQGRGSAANSAVCWVLGITSIDPTASGLLFERFVSADRQEPPDIDVDFEHERREDVIQWVYDHYGRNRAALCATVVRYRARGAVRAVGKALGLTDDVTGALASQVWGWSEDGVTAEHAAGLNMNTDDPRLRFTLELAQELIGFPRYLGTHPGGFVLTRDPLPNLVPIEPASMQDRQIIEWDKDDIDALKFMKVDVLGLGMLGCLRRGFELLAAHRGIAMGLAEVPQDDPATYAMIRRADTLGTFQIESRAQMSMLPRMKPRTLYDLTIQVAIVRPGPIQGDMVHPYLRRREGKEEASYPKPELERVLKKTLGVPLFQEQAMQVAIQCAGFTPGEADQLRRAMATFKLTGGVSHFKEKLIGGMVANGYERDFAERTFSQIEGFGSYGFPESHAASFALIAYASSWLKCHHPDVFCAALLNSQPMGFYAPAQVVRDAREHGVAVRPVDVNHSRWDCTLEPAEGRFLAVRLGMRMVKGLQADHAGRLVGARQWGGAATGSAVPFGGMEELWRRAGMPLGALERLADADAYGSLGLDRRNALWAIKALGAAPLPLFTAADAGGIPRPEVVEPAFSLPPARPGRTVVEDYGSVGLSLRAHPVSFVREELRARGMIGCAELERCRDGARVVVPGLVLVRQKPGSAKGVMFVTIEDEDGIANLILWPDVFARQRRLVLGASMIACHGRVQREGDVLHVITQHLEDLTPLLRQVAERGDLVALPTGRGDGARHGGSPDARDGKVLRQPRDIFPPERPPERPPGQKAEPFIKVETRDFR